jgi:outer membrane protein assembly factor BamB
MVLMFLLSTSIISVSMAQPIPTPSSTTEYPWIASGYDMNNTNFSPGPGPKSNHLLWRRDLGTQATAPIVYKGIVYVGTRGGDLWALDAKTGDVIWHQVPSTGASGNVAIMNVRDRWGIQPDHDEVVILSGGSFWAYDPLTGRLLRQIKGPTAAGGEFTVYNPPPQVNGQPLIFAGGWVIDYTGKLITNITLPFEQYSGGHRVVYPDKDGKSFYFAQGGFDTMAYLKAMPGTPQYVGWDDPANWPEKFYPGYFVACRLPITWNQTGMLPGSYVVATATGEPELVWEYGSELEGANYPMFYDGKVIFGGMLWNAPLKEKPPPGTAYPGHMMAWDAYTGELLWKTSWTVVGQEAATPSCHFAAAYGKVLMGSFDGNFYCIDEITGEISWWREGIGGMTYNGPQVADGIIYEGGTTWRMFGVPATIYALNATTGETVWSYDVPSPPKQNGAIADGRYYQGTTDGLFYCFGSGTTETTIQLSSAQLKAGDTVLISGQVLDQSPVSTNVPVSGTSVALMYCPLGGTGVNTIATVTTGYAGDYYYEWTVPEEMNGMYSVVASYAGDNPSYLESSAQVNFRVGEAGLSPEEIIQKIVEAIPTTPTFTDYTPMLIVVIVIAITAVIVSLYNTLTIRKLRQR